MSNTLENEIRTGPTHHVHRDDEPLPGARGAAPAVDYSAVTMEHTRLPPSEEGDTQDFTRHSAPGQDFTNTQHNTHNDRVPGIPDGTNTEYGGTQTTGAGLSSQSGPGHSATTDMEGGHGTAPAKKATMGDKLIGKTQELAGKVAHKPAMQEKGAMRTQGEK